MGLYLISSYFFFMLKDEALSLSTLILLRLDTMFESGHPCILSVVTSRPFFSLKVQSRNPALPLTILKLVQNPWETPPILSEKRFFKIQKPFFLNFKVTFALGTLPRILTFEVRF